MYIIRMKKINKNTNNNNYFKLILKIPKQWRIGQTIFNFLAWLNREEEDHQIKDLFCLSDRMFDPFHLSDIEFKIKFKEFIRLTKKNKK